MYCRTNSTTGPNTGTDFTYECPAAAPMPGKAIENGGKSQYVPLPQFQGGRHVDSRDRRRSDNLKPLVAV